MVKLLHFLSITAWLTLGADLASAWVSPSRLSKARLLAPPVQLSRSPKVLSRPPARSATTTHAEVVGSANLDWAELGFEFRQTKSHLRFTFKEGAWDEGELVSGEPYINVHVAATGLHYGQSCFEGLKAFAQKDGSVALFRPDENAKRMQSSGERTLMPTLDTATFVEACRRVTADNLAFVPPYGSGGALYLRPLLFGSGPRIGLSPADEYTLLIMVMPVGDYYKGGLATPVKALVVEGFDRAAPQGVGGVKVAGNYAADILPNTLNKKKGYPISLYLDSKTQSYIEEFSTSNFFGIKDDGKTYVTPESAAVLPSITNKSLMALATAAGLKVERRAVPVDELDDFTEVCACGTAVVITPVGSITHGEKVYTMGSSGAEAGASAGPVSKQLYSTMRAIQNGEEQGPEGWIVKV